MHKPAINEDEIKQLKLNWLEEWKQYMTQGFSKFLHIDNIELHWFSEQKLIQKLMRMSRAARGLN